jgi:aryl-alcohol dehydrogenase-like predicted oxidoreductase
MPSIAPRDPSRIPGRATPQGTLRYAARFQGRAAAGHFREGAGGLFFSSIGIGTYLGEPDAATDAGYQAAVVAAVEGGFNVIDAAINYRLQRSERSIGAAIRDLVAKGIAREEFIVCTKAGFLTPDCSMPDDANEYFGREYVERGIFTADDIAGGCHCMTPRFLSDQLDRSLKNLGLECVDVFYLHNPETQIDEVPPAEFRKRMRAAFEGLEKSVGEGKIGAYGLATWNAFRADSNSRGYFSLAEFVEMARDVGGENHHMRFVQLPLNLAMTEALIKANQIAQGKTLAMVQAARTLGISLITSAPLLQGQLTRNLPSYIGAALGLTTNSEQALQFARSTPGVTTALVGMSRAEHVRANQALVNVESAPRDQFLKLFEQRG